jgi:hypothetical protein
MVDGEDLKRKRGAVTVLALLVSLLFGYGPAAAQAQSDGSARLAPAELAKRTVPLRTSLRSQADDPDSEEAFVAAPPRVVTETGAARPAAAPACFTGCGVPHPRPLAYRARAPPAA